MATRSAAGARPAVAPPELLGTQPGLSVVDPQTILTRLFYFDGKLLRAADLRRDQAYVRSLVALSNRAIGSGIVHGFDVARAGGDALRVAAGLALAPSGQVVLLPQRVQLPIAELITRSAGGTEPGPQQPAGPAQFGRCPPDRVVGPELTLAGHPIYLLTVSSAEALCGEEERFGGLCEGACADGVGRSSVVEGVRFRVHELVLALPESTAVPFTDRHLRSRVAAALFELERRRIPSMISGTGLRNPVWCAAAAGIDGAEVPLAVFDRSGSVTTFVDAWAARRELMESTPRRYWSFRMAMRPWDVFLAQVLQFQCQLLDLGAGGGGDPGPCAEERDTLSAAGDVLAGLVGGEPGQLGEDARRRLSELREKIATVLGTVAPVTVSGSLLVDGGLVELPAAGYLPTDPKLEIEPQLRALVGPGVELRFCAVRPDFVPEALQEAQHMERISLTRGLDDPTDLEQVDVLVPGGELVEGPGRTAGYVGVARVLPRLQGGIVDPVLGSALSLSTVARESSTTGWSWTLAGYGEAPRRQSVPNLVNAVLGGLGLDLGRAGAEDAAGAEPSEVFVQPDADHDRVRLDPAATRRLLREGRLATERRARLRDPGSSGAGPEGAREGPAAEAGPVRPEPDRPLAAGEGRPVVVWLDGRTGAGLETLDIGAVTDVQGRAAVYSRAASNPVLADARLVGSLRVTDVVTFGTRRLVRTMLDGAVDVIQADRPEPHTEQVRALRLDWTFDRLPEGARFLGVTLGGSADSDADASAVFTEAGDPRRIRADFAIRDRRRATPTAGWRPVRPAAEIPPGHTPVASLDLIADATALRPGTPGRALAESVISIIGAELSVPGRDPSFPGYATDRLLAGTSGADANRIKATTDWVLFHRRRDRRCADQAPPRPVRTRTYLLYHRALDPGFGGLRPEALGPRQLAAAVQGFEPVTVLEFDEGSAQLRTSVAALRASWLAADRGAVLPLAGVGDLRPGDGETVALARLATVRSAIGDLIDVSQTEVQYLPDIPTEFHQPGLDGLMFTVGGRRVGRSCLTVQRLNSDEFRRAEDLLAQVGDTEDFETVLATAGVTAQEFVVEFDEAEEVVDPEALRAGWAEFVPATGVLGIPGGDTNPAVQDWQRRALQVAEVIGLRDLVAGPQRARSRRCDGLTPILAKPRG